MTNPDSINASQPSSTASYSSFVPLFLLSIAITLLLLFNVTQLYSERKELHKAQADQKQVRERADDVRKQLDRLAVGTLTIANAGNQNAARVVAEFERQGVRIMSTPTSGATPPPSSARAAPPEGAAPLPDSGAASSLGPYPEQQETPAGLPAGVDAQALQRATAD